MKRFTRFLAMTVALSGCVSTLPGVTPTVAPPSVAPNETATATTAPTRTASPAPTWTATATHTATVTPTATHDWLATPTPVTPTGGIVEVTPLGGEYPSARDYWQPLPDVTYYEPSNRLYIRDFSKAEPPIDYQAQPKTGDMLALGDRVIVYTVYRQYASTDRWLCIDPPVSSVDKETVCHRAVVYILGADTFGTLWYP